MASGNISSNHSNSSGATNASHVVAPPQPNPIIATNQLGRQAVRLHNFIQKEYNLTEGELQQAYALALGAVKRAEEVIPPAIEDSYGFSNNAEEIFSQLELGGEVLKLLGGNCADSTRGVHSSARDLALCEIWSLRKSDLENAHHLVKKAKQLELDNPGSGMDYLERSSNDSNTYMNLNIQSNSYYAATNILKQDLATQKPTTASSFSVAASNLPSLP